MSSPYSQSYQVFASGTNATANATFAPNNIGAGDIKFGGSVAFQYVGAAFSGTFDFQGRPHSSASWVNLPYVVMGAAPAVSVAQVSQTTDSSTITYVVLMPMEEMRVVMTRSAGTFGMWAHSFEHTLFSFIAGLTPGTGATNLGKAEDAVAASGDTGVSVLAVRADTAVANAAAGDYHWLQVDANGGLWITQATLIAGENLTANRLMTMPSYTSSGPLVADTLIRTGAAVLHSLTFSQQDATPTGGTYTVYDNTAGSGTKLFEWVMPATAFVPFTLILDVAAATGIYLDVPAADVYVHAAYLATA